MKKDIELQERNGNVTASNDTSSNILMQRLVSGMGLMSKQTTFREKDLSFDGAPD